MIVVEKAEEVTLSSSIPTSTTELGEEGVNGDLVPGEVTMVTIPEEGEERAVVTWVWRDMEPVESMRVVWAGAAWVVAERMVRRRKLTFDIIFISSILSANWLGQWIASVLIVTVFLRR